jgi:magnesium-transporting ATPase (P-type)
MAFAGTLVTTGIAAGIIVETADSTQIGRIAGMLQEVEGVDTPLIRRLAYFSKVITVVIVACCVLVFLLGILSGQAVLNMLMAAVALAVSAIPEGLPAIMTIALAIGVKRMARRNAVVRRLPAVEALGSTTVICTDKTGTLTRNEIAVTHIVSIDGRFSVTGSGYSPTGAILDRQGNAVTLDQELALGELIKAAALCNDASLRNESGQWTIDGDPTEGSLLVLAGKAGLGLDEVGRSWPRTDVIPFESESQYMATLHHSHSRDAVIYLKGSPEAVFSRCAHEWRKDEPLDMPRWQDLAESMAAEGLTKTQTATLKPQLGRSGQVPRRHERVPHFGSTDRRSQPDLHARRGIMYTGVQL